MIKMIYIFLSFRNWKTKAQAGKEKTIYITKTNFQDQFNRRH